MTVDIVTHRSANADLVRCEMNIAKRAVHEKIGLEVSLLRDREEALSRFHSEPASAGFVTVVALSPQAWVSTLFAI